MITIFNENFLNKYQERNFKIENYRSSGIIPAKCLGKGLRVIEKTPVLLPITNLEMDPYQNLISEKYLDPLQKLNIDLVRRENSSKRTLIDQKFLSRNFHLYGEKFDPSAFLDLKYEKNDHNLENEYERIRKEAQNFDSLEGKFFRLN